MNKIEVLYRRVGNEFEANVKGTVIKSSSMETLEILVDYWLNRDRYQHSDRLKEAILTAAIAYTIAHSYHEEKDWPALHAELVRACHEWGTYCLTARSNDESAECGEKYE